MEFIDLKAQYRALKNEIDQNIQAVLNHGRFIMGPEVAKLEAELRDFTGVKHCVTCANGTDALQILCMAYGIGAKDAVFCPDVTFIASAEPFAMLGATPVFCDIDKSSYNLCPERLEKQVQAVLSSGKLKPKAVVAVDFLGNPADYDALSRVCERYNLLLIEDAAQSFGASCKGKKCAGFGHSAITSFFPAKPLGCYGDGGAIFTNDDNIADICRSIRTHGKGPGGKYDNIRIGVNSRLDTIQAAILLPKLKALKDYETDARQKIAGRYDAAFSDSFVTPFIADESLSVYAQYVILAKDSEQRDKIMGRLREKAVPFMTYYPTPLHLLPAFSGVDAYGETFENSVNFCSRTLSPPMHPYLDESEQSFIISAVLEGAAL